MRSRSCGATRTCWHRLYRAKRMVGRRSQHPNRAVRPNLKPADNGPLFVRGPDGSAQIAFFEGDGIVGHVESPRCPPPLLRRAARSRRMDSVSRFGLSGWSVALLGPRDQLDENNYEFKSRLPL